MKKNGIGIRKAVTLTAAAAAAAAMLLAGCGNGAGKQAAEETTQAAFAAETGTLLLSVNPEIQIEYNQEGKVVALSGRNDDGTKIVESCQDYIGKDCAAVLEDLVKEIHAAGYFMEDIDGNQKNIVLQLEPGSEEPDDDFLERMAVSTQNAVKGLALDSQIVNIEQDDYDAAYAGKGYITLEKAKEIALSQARVNEADAVFDDKEFDLDDGTALYELEFTAGGREYEYDVDAVTGKILRAEHEEAAAAPTAASQPAQNDTDYGPNNDGVTDYNDTDYGPNNDGVTDYNDTDYGPNNDGVTDYNDTDYGPNNDGVTDYNDTDYGPNNDGVTDYNDTDYGPNNDGVTDYNDTDYGPNNDGVTDYNDTDYGPNNDGVTDYNDTDYGPNNDGVTDYSGDSAYDGDSSYDDDGDSGYDDGGSDYDD